MYFITVHILGLIIFHIRSYKREYLHQNLNNSQPEWRRIWNDPKVLQMVEQQGEGREGGGSGKGGSR